MTLNEAIIHLEETLTDPSHVWSCSECKAEHAQLLEWLKELRRLKDTMEIIGKKYILVEKGPRDDPNALYITKDNDPK